MNKIKTSIAVMPFEDLSLNRDQEYFCDGLTEVLINAFTSIEGINVISMSTVQPFKGKKIEIRALGKKLNVEAILHGSVKKEIDGTRILANLVNVSDGTDIWRYDLHLKSEIELQEKITFGIVENLKVELIGEEKAALEKRFTENVEAYNLYLKGRFFWNKRNKQGLEKAIDFFEQSVALDRNYALAYTGIADSYNILGFYNALSPYDSFPKALKAAKKALKIDNTIAEAHTSYGFALMFHEWNWKDSEKEFRMTFELNKGYATAHHWYAEHLVVTGRLEEAMEESKKALESDPLSLIINTLLGFTYHYSRKFDLAIEQLNKTIDMDPEFFPALFFLGFSYAQCGMLDEAVGVFRKAIKLFGDTPLLEAALGHAYAAGGKEKEARKMLDKLHKMSGKNYVPAYYVAAIHLDLGEKDKAIECLESALKKRDHWLAFLKVDPIWDDLRTDSRLKKILKKMNLN